MTETFTGKNKNIVKIQVKGTLSQYFIKSNVHVLPTDFFLVEVVMLKTKDILWLLYEIQILLESETLS